MKFYFSVSKVRKILLFLFIFKFIFHVCSRFQSIYLHKVTRMEWISHVKIIIIIFSLEIGQNLEISKGYTLWHLFGQIINYFGEEFLKIGKGYPLCILTKNVDFHQHLNNCSHGVRYSPHTCYVMDWNREQTWKIISKMSKNRSISRTFETLK